MNDMILNMLANDSFTVSDFKAVGLTAENTKLESEDKYLQSQKIQENELFKDTNTGEFSKDLFHQYYLEATEFYNRLSDETYLEDITKNTYYSKDNIFAPKESPKRSELPQFVTRPNPFLQNNSITRIGKQGDRTLSIAEIAQSQKIYDSKNEKFKEESVNDRALGQNAFKWLGDIFSEPLVIAQWDEDGEHVDLLTGETKSHKKGDYKYNEDGTFYYETLNGRDVYGKQVLNRMNTLTVDGSKANAYDFFDSDDLDQKNVIGSVMKNLALVGSMFLPVVGNYVAIASIATQSVGLMGALGKMFLGSDNETANNMHAWAKTVNRQTATEYASQNTWCWENLINMIGDTVGQLKEQRLLFTHAPALFKGTKGIKAQDTKKYDELVEKAANEIKEKTGKTLKEAINSIKYNKGSLNWAQELQELGVQHVTMSKLKAAAQLEKYMEGYNKLGSIISKTYMTGITVQDTYGEAKANGASDWEALALTLGYAAGELAILNSGLGEWIMPELHGDKLKYKAMVNALKKEVKPLTESLEETATKEGRQNIFKKIFNIGKRLVTDDYAHAQFASKTFDPMKVILAHASGEAFEELSEEVLADVSKAAFNTVNWLRGDETRIAGAWENMGDRYGMSLLGGFLGGGISSVKTDFSRAKQLANMTNESAIQEMIYMINNDKIDDFLKFANKQTLVPKYVTYEEDENGNFKPGDKNNNQDAELKRLLNQQVQLIKDVISAEGAKFSENSLFDALTLKDLRYLQLRDTRTAGLMFQEYNSLITKIYEKTKQIRELSGENTNTDTKKKELNDTEKEQISKLKEELKELRKQKDAIISGKRAPEFIQTALYEATPALHAHKRGYTFEGYVKWKENKNINELSETELKTLKEQYIAYRETDMKNDILGDARQFVDLVGLASVAIQEQSDYIDKMLTSGKDNALKVQTYLGGMLEGINEAVSDESFNVDEFIINTQKKLDESIFKTETEFATPLFSPETKARLDYIASTPLNDEYTKEIRDLDYMSTVLESFADYADTITQKFIDQGYIHPEVKNHLINTYEHVINSLNNIYTEEVTNYLSTDKKWIDHLSIHLGKSDIDISDAYETGDREFLFEGYTNNLKQKIEQIKALNHTPIIDLLEKFKIATSTSDLSVKDVIQKVNQLINEGQTDISTITYGEDLAKQLNEVDELIDVLASSLYATRVDKSGVNNSWGYSKTLNELNSKYGNNQWIKLAEIEGEKANLLEQDLALLKQKIHFAKNINSVNTGQKLTVQNKVGYNKQFIFFNKFERLVNELPKELTDWNFESVREFLRQDLILKKYNSKNWEKRRFSLTPEEKIQIEKESLAMDDAIYQFFQDNRDKINNIDELAKFINPKHFNLYDPITSLLSDSTEDLDDNQFIFSLAAKAALKGSSFYNHLRKTFNDEKAPIPMQEQAVYLNVAMALNGNVINNFAKAYAKSIFDEFKNLSKEEKEAKLLNFGYTAAATKHYVDNPDIFQNDNLVEKFANIILTEGIAGSGKTEGVFDSTVRVLKQIKSDLLENAFVVSANLKNAETLQKKLDLSGKVFSSSHNEKEHDLIRYFYSDYTDDYKGKVNFVGGKLQTSFTLNKDLKNLPKIIFIDEASRYDYIQMKLLSEAAQHYGIVVYAAGDFDQISAGSKIVIDGNGYNFSPNRFNFIRSLKFGLSFRTLNKQMVINQREVQANLHTKDKLQFNIHSWEDDNEIRGFKVYGDSDFDKIVESINKIKKSVKNGEKIGFLYAQEDKSLHKKIKEKFGDLIDVKSISDAQGLEGDYYIIDLNQDRANGNKSEQDWRNEFYTAFTRSRKGGIIICNNTSVQPIKVTEIKDDTSELESIKPEQIKAVSKKRKDIFDAIFKNIPDEPIEYHELTKVEKETVNINPSEESSEDEGIPPILPPVPIKTPPPGTYKTKAEAEAIDLSAYQPGLELLNSDDTVEGVIEGISVEEHKDSDDTIYYAPGVNVKRADGSIVHIYASSLSKYKLKDPTTSTFIPKYKLGDIFYDLDGNSIEIIEVLSESELKYKIKKQDGSVEEILEKDLEGYSTEPPVTDPKTDEGQDFGENDDTETYKRKIQGANGQNGSRNIKQKIESDGRINHWMYTFGSYETGVLWDSDKIKADHFDNSTVIGQRTKARIDNVNGLINLQIINRTASKQKCLKILSDIHSLLLNNTDNASILKELNEMFPFLPTSFSTIEYGIKSSAMIPKDSDKIYGTKDEDIEWHVFDKHKDEKSEYSQPNVIGGDDLSRKNIVAVFRNEKEEKMLEITLGKLNSPLTIGQMTNESGEYIYPEIGLLIETLNSDNSGENIFKVCDKAVEICNEKGYVDLGNLFKAFLNTANAYAPLHEKDTIFNLASQFNYGPNIIKEKGDYQKNGKQVYKSEYINLDDYKNDDRVLVSDVFIPMTNVIGDKVYLHMHPGHQGVFVTYNKSHNREQLAELYAQQLSETYTGKRDIEFYYVIPPEASVREYLVNSRNAYLNQVHGGTRPVIAMGNMWTSYKLLKNIYDGGDLWEKEIDGKTEWSLRSKLVDKVEFSDIISYIKQLETIEDKTDWEGDSVYNNLLNKYKTIYKSEDTAKKYALRNIRLQKQSEILKSNFKDTGIPVHKIFTNFIANAAYYSKGIDESPNEESLKLIEKHNKGTIKYKSLYKPDSNIAGSMFLPADVDPHNKYKIRTINEDGSISSKSFQINGKIDPPIFEFDALKTGIEILAQWEYRDGNPNNGKEIKGDLLNGTRGYLKNEKSKKTPKNLQNSFGQLKKNNKILFEGAGLFKDITVRGIDDPAYDQLHFAEQILTEFNSKPNNLGFAVVNPDGSIKMYALQIDKISGVTSRPEAETYQSLGGITIGKPLIFKSLTDTLKFSSSIRDYTISLSGDTLLIQHNVPESLPRTLTPIKYDTAEIISEDDFNEAKNFINDSNAENYTKTVFNELTYDQLLRYTKEELFDYMEALSEIDDSANKLEKLINFMQHGSASNINISIGDVVIKDTNSPTVTNTVKQIDGNIITLDDNTEIDISKDGLFKPSDYKITLCTKYFNIRYGR